MKIPGSNFNYDHFACYTLIHYEFYNAVCRLELQVLLCGKYGLTAI